MNIFEQGKISFVKARPLTDAELSMVPLAPSVHPERKATWYFSRQALMQVLPEEIRRQTIFPPQIIDHLHLKGHPEVLLSLSHHQNLALAWALTGHQIRSIGIDLEAADRTVRTELHDKYFSIHEQEASKLEPLEIWCAKEAAFKALSPLYKGEKLTLKKIQLVDEKTFKVNEFTGIYMVFPHDCSEKTYLIAKAYL